MRSMPRPEPKKINPLEPQIGTVWFDPRKIEGSGSSPLQEVEWGINYTVVGEWQLFNRNDRHEGNYRTLSVNERTRPVQLNEGTPNPVKSKFQPKLYLKAVQGEAEVIILDKERKVQRRLLSKPTDTAIVELGETYAVVVRGDTAYVHESSIPPITAEMRHEFVAVPHEDVAKAGSAIHATGSFLDLPKEFWEAFESQEAAPTPVASVSVEA